MEQKKKFEPFEKVLVRNGDEEVWCPAFYCYYDKKHNCHSTSQGICSVARIIPFASNEHLAGTSDMPEEEVVVLNKGELIFTSDETKYFEKCHIQLRTFCGITEDRILVADGVSRWPYCIPFSKFNPNDMEETRNHILCVKKGKLVKAL